MSDARTTLRGTTLGDLFLQYLKLSSIINQTKSWMDDLPGRLLTVELMEIFFKESPAPNALELEMLTCEYEEAESVANQLEFDDRKLRELVSELIKFIELVIEKTDKYKHVIEEIHMYFDENEKLFVELLDKYGVKHKEYLERMVNQVSSAH